MRTIDDIEGLSPEQIARLREAMRDARASGEQKRAAFGAPYSTHQSAVEFYQSQGFSNGIMCAVEALLG